MTGEHDMQRRADGILPYLWLILINTVAVLAGLAIGASIITFF
jgi:hypothetical protein